VEDDALWRDAVSTFVHSLVERNLAHPHAADKEKEKQGASFKLQLKEVVGRNPFHDTLLPSFIMIMTVAANSGS
jgi:hypothetical protein